MQLAAAAAPIAEKTNNFLIPNGTFFFEWIVFLLVIWFLAKNKTVGIPRIMALLEERQETIRKQFEDAESAKKRLEAAEKEYVAALAETRRESTRLREQAQEERVAIVDEARSQAQEKVAEMLEAAQDRIATERQQAILALRSEIGELAMTLSERIVHDSLRDDERQRTLIADFIAGVGSTQSTTANNVDGANLATAGQE